MKTPAIIEALFRFHDREAAIAVCAKHAPSYQENIECLNRFYPHGMSAEGALILKIMAASLLLGALWGVCRGLYRYRTLPTLGLRQRALLVGLEARDTMWDVWKAVMVLFFFILLIQIVLA